MATKKIYVLKDSGNNYNDESVIEIHESKENAEASRDEHAKNHPSYQFWVEEDLLFLANAKGLPSAGGDRPKTEKGN